MANRRYTTTSKKLATNRHNAQRSTGPRTPEGKAASSLNSLKHGILAKEVIGSGAILGESREDSESLLSGLIDAYTPIGRAEELAVEEIAVSYVRRARALRAERAEIEKAQSARVAKEKIESAPLCGAALYAKSLLTRDGMLESVHGVQRVTESCDRSLQQLQSGKVDEFSLGEIDCVLNTRFAKAFTAPDADLHCLEKLLSQLKSELEGIAAALKERDSLSMVCNSLPSDWAIGRTIRYESHLDREVMRAIQWLEKLQQNRRSLES